MVEILGCEPGTEWGHHWHPLENYCSCAHSVSPTLSHNHEVRHLFSPHSVHSVLCFHRPKPTMKPLKTCAIIKPFHFKSWCVSGSCCSNRKLADTPIASKVTTMPRWAKCHPYPKFSSAAPTSHFSKAFGAFSLLLYESSPAKPPLPAPLQSRRPLYCSSQLRLFWKSLVLKVWGWGSLISACRRLKQAALNEFDASQA